MLTPADINGKKFKATRLREGYDQEEVDDFLDEAADALAVVTQQLATAQERLRILEARSANSETAVMAPVTSAPAASVEQIITLAQQTADKHVEGAKTKASGIVAEAMATGARLADEARDLAEKLKGEAVLDAQKIRAEGLAEKQRALNDLESRHGQVSAALDRLLQEGTKVREALAGALNRYEQGVQ